MAKLVDDLAEVTGRRQRSVTDGGPTNRSLNMRHEGGPCPFCNGERGVVNYLHMGLRRRNTGDHSKSSKGFTTVLPGLWQGCCFECGERLLSEIAERAGRDDYVRKVKANG